MRGRVRVRLLGIGAVTGEGMVMGDIIRDGVVIK